ncbi:MAG: OmpA family protein [Chthoniobacterales bacterium]|nr:OmpA family protein [Chthoniobacterales bacterium]
MISFLSKKKNFIPLFLLGCLLSFLIHLFILKKIGSLEIPSFSAKSFDQIIPRKFKLERVTIDPKLLEEPQKKQEVLLKPTEISISESTSGFSKEPPVQNAPKVNTVDVTQLEEKNSENVTIVKSFTENDKPLISLDKEELQEEGSLEKATSSLLTSNKNYSQLDDLLKEKELLSSQPAPLLLPTDLLFEYNADQLKPEAEKNLEKLALLIKKNPKAKFIIEGFTDSFGSNQYNLDLSNRRAISIKEWLVKKQLVDDQQIEAYGLGKTHFIVPMTGTIQQQQLNRRVEIIIRKMVR